MAICVTDSAVKEEMTVGDIIELTWSNKRHGKARIENHGTSWKILRIEDSVGFSRLAGPWLLIKSVQDDDLRWINQDNDPAFKIIE